jgi:hypothetical protein
MTVGRIPVIEGGIQPTIFDAKADLLTATANDTPARLAVGTNDQVLTADSSTATGLKWAAAAAPSYTWTSYTPTWTGLTTGNGTLNYSEYLQIGKIVFYRGGFTFGSTTSVTAAAFAPSLPVAMSMNNNEPVGVLRIQDFGVGPFMGNITVYSNALESNVNKVDATYQTLPQISSTVPMTWTTSDVYQWFITYKAA